MSCCDDGRCEPKGLDRRTFLALSAGGLASAMIPVTALARKPIKVPRDKGYTKADFKRMAARGTPTTYQGAALAHIGMPVGGIGAGQLYLGGDGRLWWWDIDNPPAAPAGHPDFGGLDYTAPPSYLDPASYAPRFRQGFAIRTDAGGTVQTRALDSDGWAASGITFTGRYPVGRVDYADSASPVRVRLEAFSPFIPLDVDSSSLPATLLSYTVTNTSQGPVSGALAGWSESPVGLATRAQRPLRLRCAAYAPSGGAAVEHSAVPRSGRPDIVFADFESGTYEGWTASGTASGAWPVTETQLPSYMTRFGAIGQQGSYLVTSHDFRANPGNIGAADAETGTLTSPPFTIVRDSIGVLVGGGNQPGVACVNVVVNGQVVASATGSDDERLQQQYLDVHAYQGQTATIQVVDNATGAWGHINCDYFVFTDTRPDIVFEDFESGTYDGWTTTGTAFGAGPVTEAQLPAYMKRFGPIGEHGTYFVTSHDFRANPGNAGAADTETGTLTSPPFTIVRDFIGVLVGGGNQPGTACVNVVVNGQVVASATGSDDERLQQRYLDVRAHQGQTATIQVVDSATGAWGHVNCDWFVFTDTRADILFEDFESGTYDGWTTSGTAFGASPVTYAQLPSYMQRFGPVGQHGTYFVTSHDFRANPGNAGAADAETGTLTSPSFTIQRRYVRALVGGGNQPHQACVNVVVGGQVVATATGADTEVMTEQWLDVSRWEGRTATIQVVDSATGGWGHVNCDWFVFTDSTGGQPPLIAQPDDGTFSVAAFAPGAQAVPSLADASTVDAIFDAGPGPVDVDASQATITGAVRVPFSLAPGASTTVTFAVAWCFPTMRHPMFQGLQQAGSFRHSYATRFASSRDVTGYLGSNLQRLVDTTQLWTTTWYDDSTLPTWLLERTLASASTLATTTCYRFDSGRFYAFEGVYCCVGTCEHVWNYAQAVARLFPSLERDTRERVDLGIAFHTDTGAMDFRAEGTPGQVATDGQCGTILRIYREHQMAPDSSFLNRVWARTRLGLQYLIGQDGNGILAGAQPNTLDSTWYGKIPWISGLYVAALRAGQAMALEMGDTAFAGQCDSLATSGSSYLATQLWNASDGYFIQQLDPNHPSMNSNIGCYADQLFGQTYADQLGLPRIFPADTSSQALQNLYKYNFVPDPIGYRSSSPIGSVGRTFATSGEPGLLLCTWPFGTAADPSGGGNGAVAYFNEIWTGLEHQAAAGMMDAGLTDQALAIEQAVHNRYSATKRNPYNEVECSDHYSRAMMAFAVFLAATGYEHHGPRGHLGFAPRLGAAGFQSAFTTAQGWGSYQQTINGASQSCTVGLRYGTLPLTTLAFATASPARSVTVQLAGTAVPATFTQTGSRLDITLTSPVTVQQGQALQVSIAM